MPALGCSNADKSGVSYGVGSDEAAAGERDAMLALLADIESPPAPPRWMTG